MFVIAANRATQNKRFFLAIDQASGGCEYWTEGLHGVEIFSTAADAHKMLNERLLSRPVYEGGYVNSAWHGASGVFNSKPQEKLQLAVLEIKFDVVMRTETFDINLKT